MQLVSASGLFSADLKYYFAVFHAQSFHFSHTLMKYPHILFSTPFSSVFFSFHPEKTPIYFLSHSLTFHRSQAYFCIHAPQIFQGSPASFCQNVQYCISQAKSHLTCKTLTWYNFNNLAQWFVRKDRGAAPRHIIVFRRISVWVSRTNIWTNWWSA